MVKVRIQYYRFSSDWTYTPEKEIELDDYEYFKLSCRAENSWHLIGHMKEGFSHEFGHGITNIVKTYWLIKDKLIEIHSRTPKDINNLFEKLFDDKYAKQLVAWRFNHNGKQD